MRFHDRKILSVKGTLILEFDGGEEGTLEVDLDISDDSTIWKIENNYSEGSLSSLRFPRFESTTYSLKIPAGFEQETPQFVLRLPNAES